MLPYTKHHLRIGDLTQLFQNVHISPDQHAFSGDRGRVLKLAEHLRRVDIGKDPLLELPARVESPKFVGGAGVAIAAGMAATPVRIDGPAKWEVWHINTVN